VPVTVTYPGVYIEELPSSSHSVKPAPTSVTVFVGFTNPFWVSPPNATPPPFNSAVEIFSFADYQALFGGFFSSLWLPDYVGQAVSQFFLNGGSNAYVVALKAAHYFDPATSPPTDKGAVVAATASIKKAGKGFVLTARQPVGLPASVGHPAQGMTMTVSISNLVTAAATDDTADITIVYGTRVETYRRLNIADVVNTLNAQSSLVTAVVSGGLPPNYDGLPTPIDLTYAAAPVVGWTMISPTAFAPVFAADAPLDKVSVFNLMVLPGLSDPAALAQALAYCEEKRAFLIMDAPATAVADTQALNLPHVPAGAKTMQVIWNGGTIPLSPNGAIYFPYLQSSDPLTDAPISAPPSGFVAGIFAREDSNRGVWKSPAGLETTINGTTGVVPWGALTDPRQGVLNELGVNCVRQFPGIGSVVFGARTLVSANPAFEQWKYIAVRRTALFIEQSLYSSLGWAIFEPNDTPLWSALTQEVSAFMFGLFRQGAFAGPATKAFFVRCDATTTSQADIDNGTVNILVGFAPLKPAEFVVIQISQIAGQTQI
jgi:phage tail sheath protein FI